MDEITQVNEQLAVYIQEKRELDKLQARLNRLAAERAKIQSRMEFIETRLSEEKADVDRLDKLQKIRLLTPNDRQQAQYDKEVREYETVLTHRNQGLTMLSDIEMEERQIHQRIAYIGPIEKEYNELVRLKERLLKREGAKPYLDLIESLENLKIDHKELKEAMASGKAFGKLLDRMSRKLESQYHRENPAEDVERIYNMILGYLPRAQVAGKQFYKELTDVEERLRIQCPFGANIFLSLHRDFVTDQSAYKKTSMIKRFIANIFDEPYWEKRLSMARTQLRKLTWTLDKIMSFLQEELGPIEQQIKKSEINKKYLIEKIQ